jgi:hypothetical protein
VRRKKGKKVKMDAGGIECISEPVLSSGSAIQMPDDGLFQPFKKSAIRSLSKAADELCVPLFEVPLDRSQRLHARLAGFSAPTERQHHVVGGSGKYEVG